MRLRKKKYRKAQSRNKTRVERERKDHTETQQQKWEQIKSESDCKTNVESTLKATTTFDIVLQGVLLSKNKIWQRIKFIRQVSNAFAAPFLC